MSNSDSDTIEIESKAGDRVRRDARGRPYLTHPLTGREVTYTRTSTFAKALGDGDRLSWWRQQMLVRGILLDPRVLNAGFTRLADTGQLDMTDDLTKQAIAEIISRGAQTGGANDAADWGTVLHHFADIIDFTDDPLSRDRWDLDPSIWDALDAYVELTKDILMLSGEEFVVCDEVMVAGSYDRTAMWQGRKVVTDLKTGAVRWPDHGIQTALYAHSRHYDIETGTRVPGPIDGVNKEVGLIVHLPRPGVKDSKGRQVEPSIIPVDLTEGWRLARLADEVRKARNVKLALPLESGGESG